MDLDRFSPEPRGPRSFDVWKYPETLSSALGELTLEFIVDVDSRPDAEMLAALRDLVAFVASRQADLVAAVHGHYLGFCERDPEWVLACGVPLGLPSDGMAPHLRWLALCVE